MKTGNLIILGGLALIVFAIWSKQKKNKMEVVEMKETDLKPASDDAVVRDVKAPVKNPFIVTAPVASKPLDILSPQSYKQYNTSKMATVAPAKATIMI